MHNKNTAKEIVAKKLLKIKMMKTELRFNFLAIMLKKDLNHV